MFLMLHVFSLKVMCYIIMLVFFLPAINKTNISYRLPQYSCTEFLFLCLYSHQVKCNIAFFAGGGYVISPVNQGKQSVVKHMLAIDWKFWKSYLRTSSARAITIRMLGRVAGKLQVFENFKTYCNNHVSHEIYSFN